MQHELARIGARQRRIHATIQVLLRPEIVVAGHSGFRGGDVGQRIRDGDSQLFGAIVVEL